jgi:2',3'-cyclic-nucleotide 2'-phosphodiesterase (5'-nucleotidase family)
MTYGVSRFLPVLAASLWVSHASAAELRLRIMQTTDIHMNLLAYDYYQDKPTDAFGLSRAVSLIKAARSEAPNSLLFDNGDLIQGSPLGDVIARLRRQPGQPRVQLWPRFSAPRHCHCQFPLRKLQCV